MEQMKNEIDGMQNGMQNLYLLKNFNSTPSPQGSRQVGPHSPLK